MFRYDEKVRNLEEFNKRLLGDDEKLEIAFEEQDYGKFEELLKGGANPHLVSQTVKRMNSGRLSICQCDMLKLIDVYSIKG